MWFTIFMFSVFRFSSYFKIAFRGDGGTIRTGRGECQHVFLKKVKINRNCPFYGERGAGDGVAGSRKPTPSLFSISSILPHTSTLILFAPRERKENGEIGLRLRRDGVSYLRYARKN